MKKLLFSFTLLQVMFCTSLASCLSAQGSAFTEGYVITVYNDTIRGLISTIAPDEVLFKDSHGYEKTFYPTDLSGYMVCGMKFIAFANPGDSTRFFLAHLLKGTIDLYGTIIPENAADAVAAGFLLGGVIGGLIGAAAAGSGDSPPASGSLNSECMNSNYSIGAFYLRKGGSDNIRKVPNGRKKFNDFMIPLMRDHLEVVRGIPEDMFFTGNLISIVRQYNAATVKQVR